MIDDLPRRVVPRVLTIHGKYHGPNLYRCMWPNGCLAAKGFIADYCGTERFDDQHGLIASGRYNMIVTPRIAFGTQRMFEQWQAMIRDAALTWVYDSDDDLWSPDFPDRQELIFRDVPTEHMTRERYEIERLQRIYALKRVDAVTVTTPYLAGIASQYTDVPIHVVPNLLNVTAFEAALRPRRDVMPLTVGWSGTKRQENDLETVAAAWRIIAERNPDVKFVVQGWYAAVLAAAVPQERLYAIRAVVPEEYPAILHNIDIACCCVSDDPWNLSKSAVKYFEATLAGSACVVSEALYGDYVSDGQTGFIARAVDGWVNALQRLIDNESLRRTLQQNAREQVIERYSLERHWPEWILAWARILDDKHKLGERNHASEPRAESRAPAGAAAR